MTTLNRLSVTRSWNWSTWANGDLCWVHTIPAKMSSLLGSGEQNIGQEEHNLGQGEQIMGQGEQSGAGNAKFLL